MDHVLELRNMRVRAGLTQDELAKHLRVDGQFISNIERGKAALPAKHIKKVAKVFKVPVSDLVNLVCEHHREIVWRKVSRGR